MTHLLVQVVCIVVAAATASVGTCEGLHRRRVSTSLPILAVPRGGGGGGDGSSGGDGHDITNENDSSSSFSSAYTLGVRDSIMIAHSFHGHPSFGPAGGLHGATYTVDVEFISPTLVPTLNWVIDIGVASTILGHVLKQYNYQNLDEVFSSNGGDDGGGGGLINGRDDKGENESTSTNTKLIMTTTEFMCRKIHDDIWERLQEIRNDGSTGGVEFKGRIRVKLWESHNAWASYTGPLHPQRPPTPPC